MSRQAINSWVVLSPPFPGCSAADKAFRDVAMRLSELLRRENNCHDFEEALKVIFNAHCSGERATRLSAALYVLTDLARQDWSIRVTDLGDVEVKRPAEDQLDPMREKARIRAQELVKRDEQLRKPATRKFVERMEKTALYKGHFVSIYCLVRDGRELAESLRNARSFTGDERVRSLRKVISPYLQFVDKHQYCEHTGLRLQDIWRYFRHTWSNQYTSTPGRSMAFLIRDRAQKHHPVIGIAALGSPIVQISERDAWIGWHPQAFMEFVRERPSAELGHWLCKTVDTAIGELYLDDFLEEELVSPADLRAPTPELLKQLIAHGEKQRQLHHRLASPNDVKRIEKSQQTGGTDAQWQLRARTHLFRSKRAFALADMLRSRMILRQHLSSRPTPDEVHSLLGTSAGRRTVKTVLRKAKADRVGIAMADITVCGAIPPYNAILGGKLVSMLAASPEVVTTYRDKYLERESEIASSMAGRPIIRSSNIVFLGTTSLYGVGSSQYNRLRMPASRIGGAHGERLAFLELGKSQAYGTSHFSSETVSALVSLIQQSSNGQRVNSIFGEGVSPKFRKIRQGLDVLNLPTDTLLQHGRQRVVYGVPMVRNLREYLLGMEEDPEYIFDLENSEQSTEEISRWWAERWLFKRIQSDEVLKRVEQHTFIRPIRHGARVVLPVIDEVHPGLFDDLEY